MRKNLAVLTFTALVISSGLAWAQAQAPSEHRVPATSGRNSGTATDSVRNGPSGAQTRSQPASPKAEGAPTVDKGAGNSSLPSGGSR